MTLNTMTVEVVACLFRGEDFPRIAEKNAAFKYVGYNNSRSRNANINGAYSNLAAGLEIPPSLKSDGAAPSSPSRVRCFRVASAPFTNDGLRNFFHGFPHLAALPPQCQIRFFFADLQFALEDSLGAFDDLASFEFLG